MTNSYMRYCALAAVLATLSACDGTLGLSDGGRQLGVISFYRDPVVVEVPDTIQHGKPFTVRVRTYGGGCVSQGPTEYEVHDLNAEVTPYDDHSEARACLSILYFFSLKPGCVLIVSAQQQSRSVARDSRRIEGSTRSAR